MSRFFQKPIWRFVNAGLAIFCQLCQAQDAPPTEDWNVKFQSTYVWQGKRPFSALYTGPNSLISDKERSYSFTATAALGFRPWANTEFYIDPEAAQGIPLSNLTGLGGFTNGEMARSSGPMLRIYRARAFLRKTWDTGGERVAVESAANQLATMVDQRRWVLTAGNFSVLDVFDNNTYSHDPRTQFLNWSLMTHGAYDYAGDARGYSWGMVLERYYDDWAVRIGRFIEPKQPNQQALDVHIFQHYGDQIELEHSHHWAGKPGKLRFLAFRNRTRMSRFQDALNEAATTNTTPDINEVRINDHVKYGFGLNLEQRISRDVSLFARDSHADGGTETYAFTEIDHSLSGGIIIQGTSWRRSQDRVGIAMARNGLSSVHRDYLAAGGLGFFLGDGRLNYQPENMLETFYSVALTQTVCLTLDWQHIRNPAYNADRGPVNVASMRLHTEF